MLGDGAVQKGFAVLSNVLGEGVGCLLLRRRWRVRAVPHRLRRRRRDDGMSRGRRGNQHVRLRRRIIHAVGGEGIVVAVHDPCVVVAWFRRRFRAD